VNLESKALRFHVGHFHQPLIKMTFSDKQVQLLNEPIKKANVSTRWGDKKQTFQLSYVEGWHVIKEANRIFGFGGWSSETVDLKFISEDSSSITYIARVKITVGNVVKEGVGAGHGRMGGVGDKHESAIKEAETDARKRAFMQFGDQFGLSLYDKDKAWAKESSTPTAKNEPPKTNEDGEALTKQFIAYVKKNPDKVDSVKTRLSDRYSEGKINETQRDLILQAILEVEDK